MPGFEWFSIEEKKQVNDVLESGVLMRYNFDGARNGHWKALELESEISKKLNVKHTHLCSSGTAALQIGLAALGIGSGDEVIMPTFTFVATFEAILSVGAIPVLADIDQSLSLNVENIKKAITPKTKAVMLVHMCGAMGEVEKIAEYCKANNLFLVEDACQSIGATFQGKALGTFGDVGTYSLDYVKTITCGEGGAVFTNNSKTHEIIQAFTDHGHDHIGNDRGAENHPYIGFNFRISELNAAVGVAQIAKLDKILETQRKHKKQIKEAFGNFPQISFRNIGDTEGENASFLTIFTPDQDTAQKLVEALKKEELDAYFYWYINNWHYYKKWDHLKGLKSPFSYSNEIKNGFTTWTDSGFPISDQIMCRTISFLIKLNWSEEEIENRKSKIIQSLKAVFN
ncbi:DegT/DnrJ/EryC1/StrS family aminotransferase [Flavobacterium sp.]|uniref:DegT/DnrJ/EryC1/StrS family aminotransferase n=1 Tax=Flavobacterium sp. TaxID=239 RepID=UPI0022BF42E1|nr:DegT/DnrJ/EryC1/StrS family aminotransferase [Flavobacterium sp.]MCZ8228283.1 DegT/DnrJ/EryC1/StrS family aminotransferase [Flavobacterium sp.]